MNSSEKYDKIPEIWKGHNVADYIDSDIMQVCVTCQILWFCSFLIRILKDTAQLSTPWHWSPRFLLRHWAYRSHHRQLTQPRPSAAGWAPQTQATNPLPAEAVSFPRRLLLPSAALGHTGPARGAAGTQAWFVSSSLLEFCCVTTTLSCFSLPGCFFLAWVSTNFHQKTKSSVLLQLLPCLFQSSFLKKQLYKIFAIYMFSCFSH